MQCLDFGRGDAFEPSQRYPLPYPPSVTVPPGYFKGNGLAFLAQRFRGGIAAAEESCVPAPLSELNWDFHHERTRYVEMLCPWPGTGSAWGTTLLLMAFILAGLFGASGAAAVAVRQHAPSTHGPRACEVKHRQSNPFSEQELAVNILKQVSSGEFFNFPSLSPNPLLQELLG